MMNPSSIYVFEMLVCAYDVSRGTNSISKLPKRRPSDNRDARDFIK